VYLKLKKNKKRKLKTIQHVKKILLEKYKIGKNTDPYVAKSKTF